MERGSTSQIGGGRRRGLSPRRPQVVTVLDVGSTKVACLIARLVPSDAGDVLPGRTHAIETLGYGYTQASGVKSGVVVDLDRAEKAIRLAVDAAERMAGVTVESILVTLTAGRLKSEAFSAQVQLQDRAVSEDDIRRVLGAASAHTLKPGRAAVHTLPIGYSMDGARGIRDPRGMLGRRLGVDVHVVTADAAPLRNLALAVNRCHLDVAAMIAAPYASGLSTLIDDEAELGVACIDIGGGTTSIAVFSEGNLVHVDVIPFGGHHVTLDVAQKLAITVQDAESMKTFDGSVISVSADERDLLTARSVGGEPVQFARAQLNRAVRPRMEQILELVRDRLAESGFAGRIGRRVVLTGGGSQITGLPELARRILNRSVRLGRPLGVAGLRDTRKGPDLAAAVGLLIHPQIAQNEDLALHVPRPRLTGTDGYIARVGRWFKDSF